MKIVFTFLLLAICQQLYSQDYTPYKARQKRILAQREQSLTIVSSKTDENGMNHNFYYLSGLEKKNTILVLSPKSKNKVLIFGDEIESDYPATIYPRGKFESVIEKEVKEYERINTVNNYELIFRNLNVFKEVEHISNINEQLVYMRAVKDSSEIELLKKACDITAEGLNSAFRKIQAGMTEQELITLMEKRFQERGSEGASFYQAASGPHSVHVHFDATNRPVQDGDVVVFDIGAWYNNYTADISRTIPVNGKFSEAQREIYEVVLESQKKAIDKMKPGVPFLEVQEVAEDNLIKGFHQLGLVTDVESQWQRDFFIQHGFYHFIGLQIHDVWYDYRETLEDKKYETGMIMTMEPGVYFPPAMPEKIPQRIEGKVTKDEFKQFARNIESVYSKYAGIGIRIEDDILITEDGNKILTKKVPKEIKEIEQMMNSSF